MKDSQLKQELTEKELMFSKLQTLERENDKLNILVKKITFQYKNSHFPVEKR